LAKQARELFVVHAGRMLPELAKACDKCLTGILDQAGSAREIQARRDAWTGFQNQHLAWINHSRKALQLSLQPRAAPALEAQTTGGRLELVADGSMDDQILASRLAMLVLEKASTELNDLRLRIQHLERRQELPRGDALLPDVTARVLVDQWLAAGMTRDAWQLVQPAMAPVMALRMHEAYKAANAFLVSSGVMKEIDLQSLVKRAPGARSNGKASSPAPSEGESGREAPGAGFFSSADGALGRSGGGSDFGTSAGSQQRARPVASPGGRSTDSGVGSSGLGMSRSGRAPMGSSTEGVHEETRMMTGSTPLARARMRAQGVVGRLKRLLMDKVGGDFEATQLLPPPSPRLQQAMAQAMPAPVAEGGDGDSGSLSGSAAYAAGPAQLAQAATTLRQRSAELKQAASTASEKATIEVVALMFQAILAEERIPPSVRVWFARLQIPVLRVALAEPEFFSALQHPARRLIDRLGSCVLGFETNVGSAALETEIKRVVQVIEQYPETGRRVFQLVYDEFEKFLSTFLSEQGSTSRVVSVAQQVEQKETLAVQYTIELRKLLDDVPVRDEIRDFLFKVWVEVLALASVRHGLRHQETTALKQVATDLLWAASAKPDRNDRARVIQQLPHLLQRLRQGMALLGFPTGLQDQHIKSVSDILADAFMSRTEPIPQERLDRLSHRLAHLEDFLPEGGVGDLDLDNESIEMITGVDASNIEVITQGGSQPNEAMRAWAVELQIGAWFGLDHNGRLNSVQLAWRSQRGQLYLFAANSGRCYLIQSARVAAYLQAGLLVPSEEEALTVRATRDALAKLDANPERLLN
jgi:hypothetical protein